MSLHQFARYTPPPPGEESSDKGPDSPAGKEGSALGAELTSPAQFPTTAQWEFSATAQSAGAWTPLCQSREQLTPTPATLQTCPQGHLLQEVLTDRHVESSLSVQTPEAFTISNKHPADTRSTSVLRLSFTGAGGVDGRRLFPVFAWF